MTVQVLPWSIQGQSHSAEIARNQTAAMLGAPPSAFTNGVLATTAGGSHGVAFPNDFGVTQNGTPNMSVNVLAGRAFIRSGNASSVAAGTYAVFNDATVNVAISASDPTNPRIDLVVIQVRDTNYGEAASDARITVVTGTPAASPAVPSLASFPNALVLAQVAVAAATTSIVTANITDKRTYAYALGGIATCGSGSRPSGVSLRTGLIAEEIDTGNQIRYDGSNWRYTRASGTYTPTLSGFAIGTGGSAQNTATWHYDGKMLDIVGKITFGTTGTTFPGATITAALPASPAWTIDAAMNSSSHECGLATLATGATNYEGVVWTNSTTTLRFLAKSINAAAAGTDYLKQAATSTTIPATWAAGDSIYWMARVPATAVAP